MMGLVSRQGDKRTSTLSLSLPCKETARKLPPINQEEGPHQEPDMLALTVELSIFGTVRNKCLLLKSLRLWHFVIAIRKE